MSFSAEEFELLCVLDQSGQDDNPEFQKLFRKYFNYLHCSTEDFEQGACGDKSKLDEEGRLYIFDKDTMNRLRRLLLKRGTAPLSLQEAETFSTLINLRVFELTSSARERGHSCFFLISSDEDDYLQSAPVQTHVGLKRRKGNRLVC